MESQILDILLKVQKIQEEILIAQRGMKQDIAEIIEIQIQDGKEANARFVFLKECFNKQYSEIMNLNYKVLLLKTLD